jgi:hypothetical protein
MEAQTKSTEEMNADTRDYRGRFDDSNPSGPGTDGYPEFGDIVAVTQAANAPGISPAIVRRVNSDGTLDLTVFMESGTHHTRSATEGVGAWQWQRLDREYSPAVARQRSGAPTPIADPSPSIQDHAPIPANYPNQTQSHKIGVEESTFGSAKVPQAPTQAPPTPDPTPSVHVEHVPAE